MATFPSTGWPAAATVTVYLRAPLGGPTGSSVTSGTADTNGAVTFSGLTDATNYVATDGSKTVNFRTPAASTGSAGSSGLPAGGVRGQTLRKNSGTDGDATWTGSGLILRPQDFGAKGDGRFINDVAITSGQATLTSTQAAWTNADVGKVVLAQGAGASGDDLRATVLSVAGNVATLSANAGTTVVAGSAFHAIIGTDDTAALQSAVDAVANAGGGIVDLGSSIYVLDGALKTAPTIGAGTGQVYRTQIALPSIVMLGADKVTVELRGELPMGRIHGFGGSGSAAAGPWTAKGAALVSTKLGLAWDATFGNPSVIGGPNLLSGYTLAGGLGNVKFTNVGLTLRNVAIVCPQNPSLAAVDASLVASCRVYESSAEVLGLVPTVEPTRPTGQAWMMPLQVNNVPSVLDNVVAWGYFAGFRPGEHGDFGTITAVDCIVAVSIRAQSFTGGHAFIVRQLVDEQNKYGLAYADPTTSTVANCGAAVAIIDLWDIEDLPSGNFARVAHIKDANNLRGSATYQIPAKAGAGPLVVSGTAANFFDFNLWNTLFALPAPGASTTATGTGYRKDRTGRLTMDGFLTAPAGGVAAGTLLFTMPAGQRPGGSEDFAVYQTAGAAVTLGAIQILANGQVYAKNAVAANESILLNQVSYQVAA